MRRYCSFLLLLSTFALAQAKPATPKTGTTTPAKPAAPAASAPASTPAAELPPTAPVITVNGLCATKPAAGGECKTVVTRAQFDKLVDALAPAGQAVSPQMKRQFAQQYSRLLLMAVTAEKDGLANNPDTQQLLQFARMQALAQELSRVMQKRAEPTEAEQRKYYADNQKRFTQYTLDRIVIPISPGKEGQKPEDMKAFAEQLRARAVKGEDFKTLQKEAFDKVGMTTPPETHVVMQADAFPPSQQPVMQLKPGEVSQVLQEPSGIYIYKMISTEPVPFDKVAGDIKSALLRQKLQQESEALMSSVTPEFNPQYFGEAPSQPGIMGVRPGGPSPATPGPKPPTTQPPTPPPPKP